MGVSKKKKLLGMVLTVALITVNGVILYGARDFYLMLNPTNSNYIFFIGAINKGLKKTRSKSKNSFVFSIHENPRVQKSADLEKIVKFRFFHLGPPKEKICFTKFHKSGIKRLRILP